jgi:hypothetical protein
MSMTIRGRYVGDYRWLAQDVPARETIINQALWTKVLPKFM